MCYSAQIHAAYDKFVRAHGAILDIHAFVEHYGFRYEDPRVKSTKAMEDAFAHPRTDDERKVWDLIQAIRSREATALEQKLFKQRKRLADAERTLANKTTKAATESRRIATDKISWAMGKLADLRRVEPKARDSRIYPGVYAPVMIWEKGSFRL